MDFQVECEYRNMPKKYAKDRFCDDGLLIRHDGGEYTLKCEICVYLPENARRHLKKERDSMSDNTICLCGSSIWYVPLKETPYCAKCERKLPDQIIKIGDIVKVVKNTASKDIDKYLNLITKVTGIYDDGRTFKYRLLGTDDWAWKDNELEIMTNELAR